jgi:mRNA interferase RelE/StbE
MNIKVEYTRKAVKDLQKLDTQVAQKIVLKIKFYISQEHPLENAKKLSKPFDHIYRFRIGEYRVLFDMTNKQNVTLLTIQKIGHRKEVYGE